MSPAEPVVVGPGEGERRSSGEGEITLRLIGRHTGDRVSLIELHMRAGVATPLHRQPYDDETIHVLEGRLTVHLDGVDHRAQAGAVVFVPREVPHALRAEEDTRLMLYGRPVGQERYLRACSAPVTQAPAPAVPARRFAAIARHHAALLSGVEVLGDAPFYAETSVRGPDG